MPETLTLLCAQSSPAKMRGGILHLALLCGSGHGVDLKEYGAWIC
jgi:hypothetical protein